MIGPDSAASIRLNLLMGKGVPVPAPAFVMEALDSAEIALSDKERSGFSLVFKVGRSPNLAGELPLLKAAAMKAGARVVVTGIIGLFPEVLIDGIIDDVDFQPAANNGAATLTLKGFDLTVLMDKEERTESYDGLGPGEIAMQIITRYARYGIVPAIIPPKSGSRYNPVERSITQTGTDLAMLNTLAAQNDYIFNLIPGPLPMASIAYWGPKTLTGGIQSAITTDMGPETNVSNLSFELSEGEAAEVEGNIIDPTTGISIPLKSFGTLRIPLSSRRSITNQVLKKTQRFRASAGQNTGDAMAAAQAQSDATTHTLTAKGDLDVAKYGRALKPAKLVGIRGAGFDHDGLYYVKGVVHKISVGSWLINFCLSRDGLGSTVPIVLQ